jgi:hypothetical protein
MFDYHWRAGLRPKAQAVMAALSGWLVPRGTTAWSSTATPTCSRSPSARAQTAQILNSIRDPQGIRP